MKYAKRFFKANFFTLAILSFILFSFLMPHFALAQNLWNDQIGMDPKDGDVGGAFGQVGGDRNDVKDIRVFIGDIIAVILGFIGIIFLGLTIYGGFLWMTASGAEDQVSKAKKLLISGIIGLIVIVASYSLATFVTDAIYMNSLGTP